MFTEETHTLVLSMHGAGIVSRQRLVAEQELVPFAAEEREAPAIFVNGRVTNVKKLANGEMYRCGVEFVKG